MTEKQKEEAFKAADEYIACVRLLSELRDTIKTAEKWGHLHVLQWLRVKEQGFIERLHENNTKIEKLR